MKGDFTRSTYKPEKKYSSVRMQQGRVQLDADWNEQMDISSHRIDTNVTDIIGCCGTPFIGDGFKIEPAVDKKNITIHEGNIYVCGILCENPGTIKITEQDKRDIPGFELPVDNGIYLAYLDVWQRHITANEDPDIREVALSGPDTATRTKTVWQVKLESLINETGNINCKGDLDFWNKLTAESKAKLIAFTYPETPSENPCIISPGAGYRRLENQLYRVEVHDRGEPYIWPRPHEVIYTDAAVVAGTNDKLTVSDWQPDGIAFNIGQMVEIFSDNTDAEGKKGKLVRIINADKAVRQFTLSPDITDMKTHTNLRVRRIATFKWSRDNASLNFAIEKFITNDVTHQATNQLKLSNLGRDRTLTLCVGDWVEVLDDAAELLQKPGTMAQVVDNPDTAENIITLDRVISGYDIKGHPKVRRWDQKSETIEISYDQIELEDGVYVKFSGTGQKTGDYWQIPARTATGDIEWQKDDSINPQPVPQMPQGEHHYCRLALLNLNNGDWTLLDERSDCRPLFPKATELSGLFYVSGDGQEAMPDLTQTPPPLVELDQPLKVGVANGQFPVKDEKAKVRFEIVSNGGRIKDKDGVIQGDGKKVEVFTDNQGIAICRWELDPAIESQQVKASLLDANGNIVHLSIIFTANLSVASKVAYVPVCEKMKNDNNVQEAIDHLSQITNLFYVGGSGQESIPGQVLPQPLETGVANKCAPIENTKVRYQIKIGEGTVMDIDGNIDGDGKSIKIPTDSKGIAACKWRPDSITQSQMVEAVLLDANDSVVNVLPVHFNSNISISGITGCCIYVYPGDRLETVLNKIKDSDVICLRSGWPHTGNISIKGRKNIVIRGCSPESKMIVDISISDCKNVVISNLDISGNVIIKNVNGLYIKDNIITQTRSFDLIDCSCVKIERNTFRSHSPVYLNSGTDIEVSDNTIAYQGGYIFCWEDIPGIDIDRLKNFLILNFGLYWVKTAVFHMVDENTIESSAGTDRLSLILKSKKTKAVLKLNDVKADEFIVRIEKGKNGGYQHNIYQGNSVTWGILANSCEELKITGNSLGIDTSLIQENQVHSFIEVNGGKNIDLLNNWTQTVVSDSMEKKNVFGVYLSDVIEKIRVKHNSIEGVNGDSIYIYRCRDVFHDNNALIANRSVLRIDNSGAIEFLHNTVKSHGYGLYAHQCKNLKILDNRIETDAILFEGGDDWNPVVRILNVNVVDILSNEIKTSDTDITYNKIILGLFLSNVSGNVLINDNKIFANSSILIDSSGETRIHGNLFYSRASMISSTCKINNVQIFSPGNVIFTGNSCETHVIPASTHLFYLYGSYQPHQINRIDNPLIRNYLRYDLGVDRVENNVEFRNVVYGNVLIGIDVTTKKYSFMWDYAHLPGIDREKLIQFLEDFGVYWARIARIDKINANKIRIYYGEYLFCWDNIPGKDNGILQNVILQKLVSQEIIIHWVKTPTIEKIDNGSTIRFTDGKNSISLKLNIEKTVVSLEINDVRTYELFAKTENGKLNIYDISREYKDYILEKSISETKSIEEENRAILFTGDGIEIYEFFVENPFLFSWDKIPGSDNERLIEFLIRRFSINWVRTANIINNGSEITLTYEQNILSLILNGEKTRVNLQINNVTTYEFVVKLEKDKLNIYDKLMLTDISAMFRRIDSEDKVSLKISDGRRYLMQLNNQHEEMMDTVSTIPESRHLFNWFDIQYLFNWESIPGSDNERLIEFLTKRFGIDWVGQVYIVKGGIGGRDIRIYDEETNNIFRLTLNPDNTRVYVEQNYVFIYEFIVNLENHKLNIYDIPEKDSSKFITFLKNSGVYWVKKEMLNMTADGLIISARSGNNFLTLERDEKRSKAILAINGRNAAELITKVEADVLKLYKALNIKPVTISGKDITFNNNQCMLDLPYDILTGYGFHLVHIDVKALTASVIGNTCRELLKDVPFVHENIDSIKAGKKAILVGNISTNNIEPLPQSIQDLNLPNFLGI